MADKSCLVIGNKNYSSWSMRAWLAARFAKLPFTEIDIALYQSGAREKVKALGGETGLVPLLVDGECVIWETNAIVEHLYETCSQIWPSDPVARAKARSVCGEVSTGFMSLRNQMPVNIRARLKLAEIDAGVQVDIDRICHIWETCAEDYPGPWLFGEFCAADIYFAPIATRFQSYGVRLIGAALRYQQAILTHPLVLEWIQQSQQDNSVIGNFESS